ncbi:MAG: hypothetical protein DSM106950_21285 [Stigonema ocellatum SAG 48.90 = DSM 106950]|nr:hypothetical protein [Stigonema ocellatum SAG 48.90 = DSM 106950]
MNFTRYIGLIKKSIKDYRWLLTYLQTMDYHPNHRRFISSVISYFLPKSPQLPTTVESKKLIQTLKEDGLVVLDNLVTQTQIEEIRAYLATKFCIDPYRPEKGKFSSPEFAHKSCAHAYYTVEDLVDVPHLLSLANDATILRVIESIFGAKPTISLIQIWWLLYGFDVEENSHDREYVPNPRVFHRDVDDWSEIKLFIYLTDVDEGSGPHAFIKKSHTWLLPHRQKTLDINNADFPFADNLIKLTGEAGLAWLENSYGLHRAIIPTNKHRLILAVTYTLFPLPRAPKIPVWPSPEQNQFDPYINRVYLKYR